MHIQEKELTQINKVCRKEFVKSQGPFVKSLDKALESFNVHRQAYYGGTFVGNHVHASLKVSDTFSLRIKTLVYLAYLSIQTSIGAQH